MKIEIVYPGDGWVLDRLAKVLIERIPGAYGSVRSSHASADTDLTYFMHYGLFSDTQARLRACFLPHKEAPDPVYDRAATLADFCVAPSGPSVSDCRALNPRSHLIYHGIDMERFKPRLRIGFVGREYPSGRKGSTVFSLLRSLDYVDFHATNGALPDAAIPDFIASMDYILIASKHEGGPLCFQEALAAGKQVISTDVGMVSDFKGAPGVHLYPYDDATALLNILQAELAKRLALRRTVELYSEGYWANAHEQLFKHYLRTVSSISRGTSMLPRVNLVKSEQGDFLVFGSDSISTELFKNGHWDKALLDITRFFLQGQDAPLVLDIGANLGAYTVPIATFLQKSGGHVMAFEPQRTVYYQLCGNIFLNRLDNVTAMQKAVGDSDGSVEIPRPDYHAMTNIGGFSIDEKYRALAGFDTLMSSDTEVVPIITLDNLSVPKSPAFLKIDVEGLELKVLQGARRFLQQHAFPPFLFEVWSADWFSNDKAAVLTFVQDMGYKILHLSGYDHIAQHPDHPVQITFTTGTGGSIVMSKTR